jgi:hypothetical protein
LVLPEYEFKDDDPTETQADEEACNPDNEEEHEDDFAFPEGDDNGGSNDILSMITKDNQEEMLQQNRMLLKLLFQHHTEWKEARTLMLTELDHSRTTDTPQNPGNQFNITQIIDPLRNCGGTIELDQFLKTLRLNISSPKHLFPRGNSDQVKYVVSVLDTLHNHTSMTE